MAFNILCRNTIGEGWACSNLKYMSSSITSYYWISITFRYHVASVNPPLSLLADLISSFDWFMDFISPFFTIYKISFHLMTAPLIVVYLSISLYPLILRQLAYSVMWLTVSDQGKSGGTCDNLLNPSWKIVFFLVFLEIALLFRIVNGQNTGFF